MNISSKNGYAVIEMPGHISAEQIDQMKGILSLMIKPQGKKFIIDMGKVTNLYSSALGLIAYFCKEVKNADGELYIVNVNESIENALRSANMDAIVSIFPTMMDFELEKGIDGESKTV